ncbi:single-stranded DNA-binding protein [Nostocales cyanobacterium LEGE 11386]|nr:single-stranded DNA-binding protein [Nostocales cyanobacterium LEGE 11386]
MNSCVLMAEIIQEPQLRYTADNLAVTEMLVQFPNSQRTEDQLVTLKVVGWGNLATEIQQNYHQGDRVIIAGRLGMHTVERQEGFKEKRAELTVQQIQSLGSSFSPSLSTTITPTFTETSSQPPSPQIEAPSYESPRPVATTPTTTVGGVPQTTNFVPTPQPQNLERTTYPPVKEQEPDPDDIPF